MKVTWSGWENRYEQEGGTELRPNLLSGFSALVDRASDTISADLLGDLVKETNSLRIEDHGTKKQTKKVLRQEPSEPLWWKQERTFTFLPSLVIYSTTVLTDSSSSGCCPWSSAANKGCGKWEIVQSNKMQRFLKKNYWKKTFRNKYGKKVITEILREATEGKRRAAHKRLKDA